MEKLENFMRRAIDLACTGMKQVVGGPFVVVFVRNGVIVGEGRNQVIGTNDPTAKSW